MYVLQMLVDALVAARPDGEDIAPSVAANSLDFFGKVDGVLDDPEQRTSRQEFAETAAREECLRILHADLPLTEQATRIRALSEQRAREPPVPTLEQIRYYPSSD
jgi:2-phospho-L-lactate guanylyltransferase (CobY/MobA/RfbA family)